jgi:palmitoyltransferase
MLQRIIDGRTDLIFDYLERDPADAKDQQGRPLIVWCAYHGDVSAIRYLLARGESLESLGRKFIMFVASWASRITRT